MVLREKSAHRVRFCLAAALVVGGAVPIWAQSYPSIPRPSQVPGADGSQATAGGFSMRDYQLDRSEEDWSSFCRQANLRDDLWDPLKCVGLGRPFWYASFGTELRGSYEVYRKIATATTHRCTSLRNSRVVLSLVAMEVPGRDR